MGKKFMFFDKVTQGYIRGKKLQIAILNIWFRHDLCM